MSIPWYPGELFPATLWVSKSSGAEILHIKMTFYLGTAGADLLGNEQSLLPASAVEVTVTRSTPHKDLGGLRIPSEHRICNSSGHWLSQRLCTPSSRPAKFPPCRGRPLLPRGSLIKTSFPLVVLPDLERGWLRKGGGLRQCGFALGSSSLSKPSPPSSSPPPPLESS